MNKKFFVFTLNALEMDAVRKALSPLSNQS